VVSPILANLFLHYAFDSWMKKHCPYIPFERYADDIICHCKTEAQALWLKDALKRRFALCKLALHPDKTKIVYCKDDDRTGGYPEEKFDFLGYTFMARRSKNRWGKYFVNFCPAVSTKAAKEIRHVMRQWALHNRSDKSLDDLAGMFNPVLRGWIAYYGSPRSFFISTEPNHCAHRDAASAKAAMITETNRTRCGARSGRNGQAFCEIWAFEQYLCCRTCVFEDACMRAALLRLPCHVNPQEGG